MPRAPANPVALNRARRGARAKPPEQAIPVGVRCQGRGGPRSTLLAPPLALTAAVARSEALAASTVALALVAKPSALTAIAWPGHGSLAGGDATLSVASLRLVAQFAATIVTRIGWHGPPVRALRCELCLQGGSVAAEGFSLFALGYGETGKTVQGSE